MMGKVIMSGIVPPLVAPVTGIQLGDIAEGSIVKLNENGSPVEFYVAKHDYESALNGSGRTLLVRKDCYDSRAWGSNNKYAGSSIDTFLNGSYKALLPSDVQTAISTTKFYYTPGNSNFNVTTLERSIFLLSMAESYGRGKYTYANNEGEELPIIDLLRVAYLDGSPVHQWTRSPGTNTSLSASNKYVWYINSAGTVAGQNTFSESYGCRPCFTLPSGALFDEETMLFNGKIA